MACKAVVWILVLAWLVALGLYLVVTYGWIEGLDPDLTVFLSLLGLPWVLVRGVVAALLGGTAAVVVAGVAPIINLIILSILCRQSNQADYDWE